MSLINDALRRASQAERERPIHTHAPIGMEPAAAHKSSIMTRFLIVTVLIILVLAGVFFWKWLIVRSRPANIPSAVAVHPMVAPPVVAVAPKPVPAPVAVVAPPPVVAPVPAPAPAPVAVAVVAPIVTPASPPVAAPAEPVPAAPVVWPFDLKLTAIFYSLQHPRVILNGGVYGLGDTLQDITVTKIDKNKVTVEWNHHVKELLLDNH